MRYKHYEQMSDEVLAARSIAKAHHTVKNSGKMQLFKSMPAITSALIGTSIALTQPGKLSAKAALGLGFLVCSNAINKIMDTTSAIVDEQCKAKKPKSEKAISATKIISSGLSVLALGATAFGVAKGSKYLLDKYAQPVKNFLTKEVNQLSNEINSTGLAKFNNEVINPFLEKHPKFTSHSSIVAPLAFVLGGAYTQARLAESMSKDVKREANKNFIKGKLIQEIAKKEFDSIDAKEV